ncbi:fimbrial biogenesis chaperone [Chryseobacterium defluvii]|uniref:P pilus assembly chaperone PapD n=1 Tax=Chryseobacterium defluvii TaxID=160396 RepID=A0A495SRC2_9FLAO|nr:molecular chaperone [Chryseobacterium defluvii]RKT02042.1 P pilus assembly chaperone PapD [Chryseobacterium defluvii]
MKKLFFSFACIICSYYSTGYAQTGVSVSPPRVYFESDLGNSNTQKVTVTNVSTKNSLDFAVSLGDWEYDHKGENVMYTANTLPTSCTSWVTIKKEDNYFTLGPGERKDIDITITVPNKLSDKSPVSTAVLYVSQMNPVDDVDSKGAHIKVSIRSGIKLFHKLPSAKNKKLEIKNLIYNKSKNALELFFENQGDVWTDGKVYTDLVNTQNGEKTTLEPVVFYTMPGNNREMSLNLPATLQKGKYTASVMLDYEDNNLEMGELNFTYE